MVCGRLGWRRSTSTVLLVADLLKKQLIAVIDKRSTMICLRAAGQIQPVDEPFDTLMGFLDAPPFHVHCRSIVVPWMPGFVSDIRKEANAEIANRPEKQKRFGPDGYGGRLPPRGPVPVAPPQIERVVGSQLSKEALEALYATPFETMSDHALDVLKAQGFDGLPTVVSDLAGVEGVRIYRGVGQASFKDEFVHGQMQFVGRGLNGQGFYFSDDAKNAASYGPNNVIEAVLSPSARVAEVTEMFDDMRGDWAWETAEGKIMDRVAGGDPGLWAAMRGYDAVRVDAGGATHYVVLNRTALTVKGD